MITQKTITVDGRDFLVNVCDQSSAWIMVHNGIKAMSCDEIGTDTGQGKLETIHTIFEAASKDECRAEATRLGLIDFEKLFPAPRPKPTPFYNR